MTLLSLPNFLWNPLGFKYYKYLGSFSRNNEYNHLQDLPQVFWILAQQVHKRVVQPLRVKLSNKTELKAQPVQSNKVGRCCLSPYDVQARRTSVCYSELRLISSQSLRKLPPEGNHHRTHLPLITGINQSRSEVGRISPRPDTNSDT